MSEQDAEKMTNAAVTVSATRMVGLREWPFNVTLAAALGGLGMTILFGPKLSVMVSFVSVIMLVTGRIVTLMGGGSRE